MKTHKQKKFRIFLIQFIAWLYMFGCAPTVTGESFHPTNPSKPIFPLTSPECDQFTFDATYSKIPEESNVSYFWDLGDGATSIDKIVTHSYTHPGNYTVQLSLTDNSGETCNNAIISRVIRAVIPPQASFISDDFACINDPILFDARASESPNNKVLRYFWDFGDGSVIEGSQSVLKAFLKGGEHKVFLTVDDGTRHQCGRQTAEKDVRINVPPVAQAGGDELLKCVHGPDDLLIQFDASASTDTDHDPLSYIWDFGDGGKASGPQATHRYHNVGNYEVKLFVSDDTGLQCSTDVDFISVRLNKAQKADAGEDILTCVGEEVVFDGSHSFVQKQGTVIAQWSLGDGTTRSGLSTKYRYDRPGTYEATLTLENKLNSNCPVSRDTRIVTVHSPPKVTIEGRDQECTGNEVFFEASTATDPDSHTLNYYWNFGDGSTSRKGAKVSHKYTLGGKYRVSVVVDNQKKSPCSTATAYANIHINTPPTADAGPNLSCCVNKEAIFSANASNDPDGDNLTYTWQFGEGNEEQGKEVTHAYAQSGSYNVTLTVDDNSQSSCSRSTDSFTATVKETLQPVITIK